MSVTTSTPLGTTVLAPAVTMRSLYQRSAIMDGSASLIPAERNDLVRVIVWSTDPGDGSLSVAPVGSGEASARWVHQSYLSDLSGEAPDPAVPARAVENLRERHAAEIARLVETHRGALAALRSNANATARIERDEEIGEALADMLEDDSLDTDTVNALADRLGVEIPEREYEVDVTITISRTIRVKAANREAAHSLATGDTSFVDASLQVDDAVTIDGDSDVSVEDDGAGYGEVDVRVSGITRA